MAEIQTIHPYDLTARLGRRSHKNFPRLRDGSYLIDGMWLLEDWHAPVVTPVGMKILWHYHARATN